MTEDLSRPGLSEILWYTLAAIFFTVGIIGTLGEYVFHWWGEPFDVWGPLSLALGGASLAWSASARDVRAFRRESAHREDGLLAGQREQTAMLRSLAQANRSRRRSSARWWPPFVASDPRAWARGRRWR